MQDPTSASNSTIAKNLAYNLAHCYANGYGVEKDVVRATKTLSSVPDLQFLNEPGEGELHTRSSDGGVLGTKEYGNEYSFSRSIVKYQKTMAQRFINTIQCVKVAQNADSWQPWELQDRLHTMSNVNLTQVQNADMVSFLLENNANPMLVEETGVSTLHLLVFFEPSLVHRVGPQLIARGAKVFATTRRSHAWTLQWHGISLAGTPMHFAVGCRNTVVIKFLLDSGADPNQRAALISPLDLATSFNLPEICTLLIEHGATTNKHWLAGRSPLHFIGDSTYCSPLGKVCYC
jgi:hypothetical protein